MFTIVASSSRRQVVSAASSFASQKSSFIISSFSTIANNETSPYYTVAITGASGMLGNALIDELTKQGNKMINGKPVKIVKLNRDENVQDTLNLDELNDKSVTTLNWNPKAKEGQDAINSESLEKIDTVVHLAGENVGTGLLPFPLGMLGVHAWSQEKKDLIMNSRVGPTKVLGDAIAKCSYSTNYVVASGVGVYGNDFMANESDDETNNGPDESVDVSQTKGFLADISREWEAASKEAIKEGSTDGNRVVNLRIAPILSKKGGALQKLYPIFFMGGGGIVGSGKQYFSYISARDAARSIVHVMENKGIEGPVNLVAPTPATNAQFTSAFGKVLGRPTIIPLPEFAVKLMFGEMGEEMLLGGVKCQPKKLLDSGFEFQHETIETALESAVNETI